MGNENINVGSDLTLFWTPESALLTPEKPTAAYALRALSCTVGRPKNYIWVRDVKNTRSRMVKMALRQPVCPFNIRGILRPSGAAGTAPEIGDLLKHLCGTETVTPSTSVAYTLLKDMTALSASLYVNRSHTQEGLYGCVVNRGRFTWGNELILWEFSGEGKQYLAAGYSLANGAEVSGSVSLTVDDASNFLPYGIVQIGSDTNSGAGYRIESISGQVLTLDTSTTWSDDAVVKAYLPTPSYAGNPLGETEGSLSLDNGSTTQQHLGGFVEIRNGVHLLNVEAFQSAATDVIGNAYREVEYNVDFLSKRENLYRAIDMRAKTQYDGKLTFGSTAGSILTIDSNILEFEPSDQDSAEVDTEHWSGRADALGSSGEDEITLTFT